MSGNDCHERARNVQPVERAKAGARPPALFDRLPFCVTPPAGVRGRAFLRKKGECAMKTGVRLFCLLLCLAVALGAMPVDAGGGEDFSAVISLEGLTLGQGFYVGPASYTLGEINALLAREGAGPYTAETVTVAALTRAMLLDRRLEARITGSWEQDVYLSAVQGVDTGNVAVPDVLRGAGVPESLPPNTDDWLGEFDYTPQSGWMVSVNHRFITGSASGEPLPRGAVVRWQFTLSGYGADLGCDSGFGAAAYFTAPDRSDVYRLIAGSGDGTAKSGALGILSRLDAGEEEVARAEALFGAPAQPHPQASAALHTAMARLAAEVPAPGMSSVGGEWTVIALARGGYYAAGDPYFQGYLGALSAAVREISPENGRLHGVKSTENSRVILALTAIGEDPADFEGIDLLAPLRDADFVSAQGINGPVFALIALDAGRYEGYDEARETCLRAILDAQTADGGWSLSGFSADPDITAMALQALSPYAGRDEVREAGERGFACLSALQRESGGYASWGTVNAESIAQAVIAATSWGIDPQNDPRFVRPGGSAVSALLSFFDEEEGMFSHTAESGANLMASEQGCLALAAYERFTNGRPALYDMGGVEEVPAPGGGRLTASLSMPEEAENREGSALTATVFLSGFVPGVKLIDGVMNLPRGVSVTGMRAGDRLSGGQLSWAVEPEERRLRFVYFDAGGENDVTLFGEDTPIPLLTVTFSPDGGIADGQTLRFELSGLTLKTSPHQNEEGAMVAADISGAFAEVTFRDGFSFTAARLYTGDGVDLIPADWQAVSVAVTGARRGDALVFHGGALLADFACSAQLTGQNGETTFVCMAPTSVGLAAFADPSNYTVEGGGGSLDFGDANGDGRINAQDALNAVNAWLRSGDPPSPEEVLRLNVNGDSRINTFDALGIAAYIVDGESFDVLRAGGAAE